MDIDEETKGVDVEIEVEVVATPKKKQMKYTEDTPLEGENIRGP